ncbi:MAG: YraN family protein [Candidatus Cloacimonetes bacterium]|nr:YraN family protein [Candidatus Cloacimonadota bacterium]
MSISDGITAESFAAHHLARNDYRILTRNHHCREGEIDIVFLDGECLVFCEVKQRSGGHETALLSVSARKQRKLVAAALHYLARHPELDGLQTRFDVITVTPSGSHWKVNHVLDAFRPEN